MTHHNPARRRFGGHKAPAVLAFTAAMSLVITGCAGSAPAASDDEIQTAADALDPEMRELYLAAVEEGEVLIYTGRANSTIEALVGDFEKTYPGIEVASIQGGGEDSVQRLFAETEAGRVTADVLEAGAPDFYGALTNDLTTPCEVTDEYGDETLVDPDGLWNVSTILVDFTAYNTDLIAADEAPNNFDAFATEEFRDRVMTSDSLSPWQALRYEKFDGDLDATKAYFQSLADNGLQIFTGNPKQTAELMASGQRPVFAWANDRDVAALRDEGASVDRNTDEAIVTLYLSGCVNDAPHPEAARLWISWLLSEAGQQSQVDHGYSSVHPTVESPIDVASLDQAYFVRPEYAAETEEDLAAYSEVFGLG